MKMTKIAVLISALFLVFAWSSALSAASGKYSVKFAHQNPPNEIKDASHAAAVGFKYLLEKQSGGKFDVQIYPSATLGKEVDVLESLKANVVQISVTSAAGFFRVFPPAVVMYTPYIFRNANIAMEVVNGPFGDKLKKAFEKKTGLVVLGIQGGYTYAVLTNNKRPIRKPSDMKGLKFRVMDPMAGELFKSLGAGAVPIAWPEVYTSLQTGVVDGQTNPAFIVSFAKFNEVQNYMTLANSQWGYQLLLANKQWYDSLSDSEERLVKNAMMAATHAGLGVNVLLEKNSVIDLQKKGMKVEMLSDDQILEFQKIAKPHCLNWARKALGAKWVDELESAIEDAEKKLGYK